MGGDAPPAVQDDVILSGGRRIAAPTGFWLTGLCLYGRIELPERAGANNKRAGGCSYISERGWKEMRITFHLWSYSITIYVRKIKNNRHSAK